MDANQRQLFMKIEEAGFALDDVVLFLDTHPTDPQALSYYNKVRDIKKALVKEYAATYGPLTKNQVRPGADYFNWIDMPWPWEGGAC